MDFELDDAQRDLVEATRAFAAEHLAPTSREREQQHAIPPAIMRELAGRGLLGVNIPAELGGRAAGVVAYAACVREVAAADASVAVTMAVTNMVAEVILRFGTPEQRRLYIPRITSGHYFGGAFALSEPGAGSDAAALTTKAERRGDTWVLNGEKMWISHGDQNCVFVLWARTNGPGPKGISCFLAEQGTPGFTPGKPEEKMGLRASHTVGINLDGVELPHSALLGEEGQGFPVAMVALDGGRIGVAAQALGIAYGALARAREHALTRRQLDKPIGERPAIQQQLADISTELDAAWLMVMRAAWLKERGRRFSREAAMAKAFATEASNDATRRAVQIVGGDGCLEDHGVARALRDCRVTQIYEGTSEVQRIVIARDVLKNGVMP